MAAPVLQDYTMRRGALTLSGAGGASLSQFMQTGGSAVTTWSVTSGSMTGLAIDASTGSITPTTNGGWGSSQRVFTIRATNADGFDEATLTVDIVASAYNVSAPTEIDSAATGLRVAATRAALGGRTVIISRGTFANWNGNGANAYNTAFECRWRGFNTHTGRFTIRPEFPESSYVSLSRLLFIGCARIDVEDLGFESWLASTNSTSNNQNVKAIACSYSGTFGVCSDITISRCTGGAPASAALANQWMSGIGVDGQNVSPYVQASNVTITDCHFQRVKDGWSLQVAADCLIDSCTITDFCSNASFWAQELDGNEIRDCVHFRAWTNPFDPGDHGDNDQCGGGWGVTGVRANCTSNNSNRNIYILGGGDAIPQGPFHDDVAVYLGAATGFGQNNCTIRNIVCDTPISGGIRMDGGSGWDTQRNTLVLGDGWENSPTSEPWINAAVLGAASVTGICKDNFAMYRDSNLLAGFPDFDDENTIPLLPGSPPSTWTNTLRLSYLTPYFQDPGRAPDWSSLTATEAAAEMREMWAPILDGPLKNVDGTYRGALFPDGTWNDGTVYEATPPSSITSSAPVSSALTGEPVAITFQLDAAANQDVSINPAVAGVTGDFTPDPATIETGAASVVVAFVATSAGDATITATNDRSLSGPDPLVLTITSPAVDPTTYTQAANSTQISAGGSIVLTYQLDALATSEVTITPASTMAGIFSAATVTIPFGQDAAEVSFTPAGIGAGLLSATNDSGLTDPPDIEFDVSAVTRGQLIVLGIR